jgi:hypothetical protein
MCMYRYEMKKCNHENAIIFPGITLKFNNIMTNKTTEQPFNSAFENVKSLFNKILGKTVENVAKPQSTGIRSTITQKPSDQPIKWPLPVKK